MSRALTAILNGEVETQFLRPDSGRVIGLTGGPGAGKSSAISAVLSRLSHRDIAVAVLAVDPSSAKTGGGVLGDRIRMQEHATHPDFFIRSIATRGELGGVVSHISSALNYLLSCGFDVIFVETVGVGQNEISVADIVDHVALLVAPHGGDEIQALKSGVMEIADSIWLTKSDVAESSSAQSQLEKIVDVPVGQLSVFNRASVDHFLEIVLP